MATSGRYITDPNHTYVRFGVLHFGTSTVRGRFDDVRGTITWAQDPAERKAEFDIDMRSLNTGSDLFNKHLSSDEFFDVEKYPSARFVATRFIEEGGQLKRVEGNLTLHGQTQPVTLQCKRFNTYDSPILNTEVKGGDFETTIQRSQWGMDWGLKIGVPDEVQVVIQAEAGLQK